MNRVRKILRRKNKVLFVVDDGTGIRGVIADHSGVRTDHHFPVGTSLKKVLEFGRKQNASCVLCLQTADVRELEVKLSADLDEEERRSAIEYAAASDLGDHSGERRISYMDGMFHDFRSGILVSYFDAEEILAADELAKSMKMAFLGITNFKQFLLAQHFSHPEHHEDAFLFLQGNHGIAAIPDRNKLLIRNLPFGIPEAGMEGDWKERVQRRLNTIFRNKRVAFYSSVKDESLCAMLQEISGAALIEPVDWEEAIGAGAVFFLNQGFELSHTALPPPKAKDPKAVGTWFGFIFLIVTLLSLGFLIGRNHYTKYVIEQEMAKNKEIAETIKTEEDALKGLEKQLAEQQQIFTVLKQQQRVSKDYLLVLNLLSRYPLKYTRITAITEKNTGIHIEGESVWQPDLSSFFKHFEQELSKYHLTLFSDGLTKEKDEKILFRSHITGAGGKR